jgi:hypothetical protein
MLKGNVRADGSIALGEEAVHAGPKARDAGTADAGHLAETLVVHAKTDAQCEWWSEDEHGRLGVPQSALANVPWKDDAKDLTVALAGHLGAKLGISAQLRREGDALTGFYRYARSGEDLMLHGPLDGATGGFTLEEKNAHGLVTGRWQGVFLSARVAAGQWTSADGQRSLPFVLEAKEDGSVIHGSGGVLIETRTTERQVDHCKESETYPEVHGLAPPSRNAQVNAALRGLGGAKGGTSCSSDAGEPLPDDFSTVVNVTRESGGILALRLGSWSSYGGPHGEGESRCALFDLATLEVFDLEPLVGTDVVDALQDLVDVDVAKEFGPERAGEHGQLCYVDATHVSVKFRVYQLGGYANGEPEYSYDVSTLIPKMPAGPRRKALFGR